MARISGASSGRVVNPDGTDIGASSSGLTDAELRATPVPVSGTIAISQTGTANDVDISTLPTQTASGSFTTVEDEVKFTLVGEANVTWQITGTWAGVISFEASNDNTNWVAIWGYQSGTTIIVQATTVNGIFRNTTAGFKYVRARYSTDTSGTAVVTGFASHGTSGIFNNFPEYGAQMVGKQEDVASGAGDAGAGLLAVQKATPANTADTDGDYEFLQMSAGRLWVSAVVTSAPSTVVTATNLDIRDLTSVSDSVTVVHAALTELGDAINGSQVDVDLKASDVDLMLGTDFSSVFGTSSLILATQADGIADTVDGLQTSSFLYGYNGTTWDRVGVDGDDNLLVSIGNAGSGTFGDEDNVSDAIFSYLVYNMGFMFDGTAWDRVRGDSTDGLLVNLGTNNDVTVTGSVTANAGTNLNTSALLTTAAHDAAFGTAGAADAQVRTIQGVASMTPVQVGDNSSSLTVDNAGTFAVQDATAQASLSVMDDWDNTASDGASVSGDVAHDSPDAGEPVKIGFKAVALKANPTEVAANDRSNWIGDVSGIPFVLGGHPNILAQSLQVTDGDGAQTDAAIITVAANVAVVVTSVSVMADNANTADVSVRIGFGTANTPAADAAQMLLFHPGIAPGSGVVEGSGSGILGIGASGEDVRVTCEDPTGGSINIIVRYFTTDI